MKMTFNRNLLIGFGLSLLLLIISSAASLLSISEYSGSTNKVTHTQTVIQTLEQVYSTLKDAESGQRGYIITGDQNFLEPYRSATTKATALIRKVKDLTADNREQQVSVDQLNTAVQKRITQLEYVIDRKQTAGEVHTADMQLGKKYMDSSREIIRAMEERENALLEERTARMKAYGRITPLILIITGIISVGLTLYFYKRVRGDYEDRVVLLKSLENKDKDTSHRISIIEDVANKISQGQYDIRTKDDGENGLGTLSGSLNKMAASLQLSFQQLEDKEWLQTGIRKLSESLLGLQDMKAMAGNILTITANYTNSQAGALYMHHVDGKLHLTSQYALSPNHINKVLAPGEGLAGQSLVGHQIINLTDIPADSWGIASVVGEAKPKSIIAIPLLHEGEVKGVLELASIYNHTPRELQFFEAISGQTGLAIHTLQNNVRVKELLQETQAQSEELQAQHSELENINAELEAQAQKLQASEEELRVQQEELLEANSALEERAHMLEERNELINARNKEIQQKAEELAQSTRYKSEFLANMSHELRTPLNSILLLSRLMADNDAGTLGKEEVEYANVINSAGKGLLSLIDEILDLSKIEAGRMQLEWEEVPVPEIAGNMQDLFQPQANAKEIELLISIADDLPDMIETDEQRLEQILKNLLANAIKFTSQGSVSLLIEKENEEQIKFSVKDTGIGIPEDKQESIFGAFQQADGSTQRKYGGTGLGLAISRELAKLLGGDISVKSKPGEGSTFQLTLPINGKEAQTKAKKADEEKEKKAGRIAPIETVTKPQRRTFLADHVPSPVPDDRDNIMQEESAILIVEDDPAFAKALLDFTRKRGYKGIVAVRGDEGLALAKAYQPAAILLDIELPVVDGWEVMQELKNSGETKHIPVHIMSSHTELQRESIQQGAVNFTPKPVATEDLSNIFSKLEAIRNRQSQKVLIVEENPKHAKALAHYLDDYEINSEIAGGIDESIDLLKSESVDCVILDMGIPGKQAYETLETIKKVPGLENLPIIIFTGKSLSKGEEERIRRYADSIVIKTAHSYQRMLDEVSLFLHLMEQHKKPEAIRPRKLGGMADVLKDKTILIADDDVRNIFSLSRVLDTHGVHVVTATDGNEALEQLTQHPETDLVLMDMMMPGLDGYETTTAIRKNIATKGLPVIAVTAKAMMGDREKCMQAGASDYITKPVDIDQLLSLLRVWLYERSAA